MWIKVRAYWPGRRQEEGFHRFSNYTDVVYTRESWWDDVRNATRPAECGKVMSSWYFHIQLHIDCEKLRPLGMISIEL